MLSKLPKFSKEQLIMALVFFAAFCFRSIFSLTQTSHFVATHIPYLLLAFVPFSILITSKLSEDFRKKLKANDIMAVVVIIYALIVVLYYLVLRYSIMTAIGITSVSMLLCTNIYLLPVAAVLNIVPAFAPQLGCTAVVSIPATICLSMVSFAYIFEKPEAVSKKKSKKPENTVPAPDYKKEKILFTISEIILLATLAIIAYQRRYTVYFVNFKANLQYIIPFLIPVICFVIFAVLTIKNKKPFIGVVGYLIAIASMPLSQLCADYSIAATGTLTAFTLLLALCDTKLPSGKIVNEFYEKTVAKTSRKKETDGE